MTAANVHTHPEKYDIAIIGSGIAGSTLGAILARNGLRVVIFEASSHPRFAIGESMILETSETMRALADLFDVPELAYFSSENYFSYAGTSHGVKRHFSFLHHTPGQPHDPERSLQAIIPKQPHGHELHLFRQDTDAFLAATAVKYGADLFQNTKVQDIAIDPAGVDVITASGAKEGRFRADYVVDAGGYRSILAERFDLRDRDLRTQSRGLFTHMVDVPAFQDESYDLPFPVSQGTLHHIFDGGWLWVIPFDNHPRATNPLCSVGLLLDPRTHPERPDLTAEEEFLDFIGRYPSIHAQLGKARAVRPWTRAGRIQYSSKQVVGDRFALLGHAVGFIDPLYSKGLYASLMSTLVLADRLLAAHASQDFSRSAFLPVEEQILAFVGTNDRLIANSFHSFRNYKLWEVYSAVADRGLSGIPQTQQHAGDGNHPDRLSGPGCRSGPGRGRIRRVFHLRRPHRHHHGSHGSHRRGPGGPRRGRDAGHLSQLPVDPQSLPRHVGRQDFSAQEQTSPQPAQTGRRLHGCGRIGRIFSGITQWRNWSRSLWRRRCDILCRC